MNEVLIALAMFACLSLASLSALYFYPKLPVHHRDDDTNTVVRLLANIFVVITSLVFGLMINASKTTFEATGDNLHTYATQLILLDKTLSSYGGDAKAARERLLIYARNSLNGPVVARGSEADQNYAAEKLLGAVGDALSAIKPTDQYHQSVLADAREQYRRIVEKRWAIVEQVEGGMPSAIVGMLIAWLTLIFASFGYRAPRNAVVVSMFLIAACLISVSIYLVLDMDSPFLGPIQISDDPLRRAVAEMEH